MTRILALVVVAALFGAAPPLAAHHSTAMYTGSKTVTGKVLKFEWTNPHAHVYIETKDDKGATVVWDCRDDEPESPQVVRLDGQDGEGRRHGLGDRGVREERRSRR